MEPRNRFEIVVPCLNNPHLELCLNSIREQDYPYFKVHVVVDPCDDCHAPLPAPCERVRVTLNGERKFALANITFALNDTSIPDDAIVAIVDGDDMLLKKDVLSRVNAVYAERSSWLTYGGQVKSTSNDPFGYEKEIEIADPYTYREQRDDRYWTHHLFTFRKWLFDKIDPADLKHADGSYFLTSYDKAIMYPMIEMAGVKNMAHTKDALYFYNNGDPNCDWKVRKPLQSATSNMIRLKRKYEPL